MRRLSELSHNRIRSICFYICACLFFFGNLKFFKMVLYYIGLHDNMTLIASGIFVLLDFVLMSYYLTIVVREKKWKQFAVIAVLSALYAAPYLIHTMWYQLAQFAVFMVPFAVCASLIVCDKDGYETFLRCFSRMANGAALLALGYILLMFFGEPGEYGIIEIMEFSYGDVALGLLPFLFVDTEMLLRKTEKHPWLTAVRALVFVCAIIYTGTRSAMVSMAIVLLVQLLRHIKDLQLYRWPEKTAFCFLLIGCILLCNTVTPSGSRLTVVKDDALYEIDVVLPYKVLNVETGELVYIDEAYSYYIVKNDCSRLETERILHQDIVNKTGRYIRVASMDYSDAAGFSYWLNRVHLWTDAFGEFKKTPLTGSGPLFFQTKYVQTFPHNVVLEAMTDFGIIGAVLLCALAGFCYLSMFYIAHKTKNRQIGTLLAFLFMYVPIYFLFTSLYFNGWMFFTISLAVSVFVSRPKNPAQHIE